MKKLNQSQIARVALIDEPNRIPRFQEELQEVLSLRPDTKNTRGVELGVAHRTLLAAAVGFNPTLCLELVGEMSPLNRPLDAYLTMQFERRASWTDAQAGQLFQLLTKLPDGRTDEICEAGNLAWFAARIANPHCFTLLASRRALAYENGAAAFRLAAALNTVAPDLAHPLFERALSQSLAQGDDETVCCTLRTAPHLPRERTIEILRTMVQRRHSDSSGNILRDAVELQVRFCPEDAVVTLNLIRPGAHDLDKILEELADALQPTSEEAVLSWYHRVAASPAVARKEIDGFLGKLVKNAANQRIRISSCCVDQIVATDKRVSTLTTQASLCGTTTRNKLLRHATAEARNAQNPFEATAASISLARAYLDFAPGKVAGVLNWGSKQLGKHRNAYCLALDIRMFTEACEQWPASIIRDVGPLLKETVLSFPYGFDNGTRGDEKARALIQVVSLSWGVDVSFARKTLVDACRAFVETLPLDYIGNWCGEVNGVARRILAAHGAEAGNTFVDALFQSIESPQRVAVADGMMQALCDLTGSGNMPLEEFGLLCRAPNEKYEWLAKLLLPRCSEKMQAKGHVVRAANLWKTARAHCRRATESAIQIVRKETGGLDDWDWEALWILNVLTQGITGIKESARQLLMHDVQQDPSGIGERNTRLRLDQRVALLIRAACFVADNKSALLRQLWQAIQGLTRY